MNHEGQLYTGITDDQPGRVTSVILEPSYKKEQCADDEYN
jgi:predicted GIY-YIG superfamily endonuclease